MIVDPLADQFAGWTPYHYVHNNPVRLVDPTGMSADTLAPGGFYTEHTSAVQDNLRNTPLFRLGEELNEKNTDGGIVIFGMHPSGILEGREAGESGSVSTMDGLPLTPGTTKNPLSEGMDFADKVLKILGIATDNTMIPDENG